LSAGNLTTECVVPVIGLVKIKSVNLRVGRFFY